MSRVKTRRTHPRPEWAKKRRERHDQELTKENEAFVNQVILQKYGPAYQADSLTGSPWMSPLKELNHERKEWTPGSIRVGVIAKKIGVHPMWDVNGKRFLATLLQVVDNHVIKYLPPEIVTRNYGSRFPAGRAMLLVGAQSADPQIFTKEYCGLFQEAGTLPKVKIHRFAITPDAYLMPGTPLYASHFKVGQYIDVIGKTVERGWQGVMKRWGFKGMPATHGVTKSHRRGGCIGGGGEKGRVWPGTKMPGHMGSAWRTLKGQQIVRINSKYNVLYVKGPSVQGDTGTYLCLRDSAMYHRRVVSPPFPTYFPEEIQQDPGSGVEEDSVLESVHKFSEPSITFEENR